MERRPVVALFIALLLGIPLLPVELLLVRVLVDRVQNWTAADPVTPIVTAAAWLAAVMATMNIALGVPVPMAMTRLIEIGTWEEQRIVIAKTARLPLALVESPAHKDLRERASRMSLYGLYNTGVGLVQAGLQAILLLVLLAMFGQWIPAAAVCAAAALQWWAAGKAADRIERLKRSQTPDDRLLRHYAGLLTKREAAKEIRLFGLAGLLADRWNAIHDRQAAERGETVVASERVKLLPDLLTALLSGVLLALLSLLPGATGLSAGTFAFLFLVLTRLFTQLPGLIGQWAALKTEHSRWVDYRAYLDLPEEPHPGFSAQRESGVDTLSLSMEEHAEEESASSADSEGDRLAPEGTPSRPTLTVTGLRFRYPEAQRDTLSGISLTIPHGCRAAVVGENGSGKSTLVKLLTGLYVPADGKIRWTGEDGQPLPSMREDGRLSAVFQDFTRLYLTIRQTLALGDPSALADDDRLRQALESAGSRAWELDRQLGAPFGGAEPSGGEWQKLATARALLRDAAFVFFDEPTAALDPQAEKEAFRQFLRLTEHRSALLVTHRLGAARQADWIFVLKDGRLAEQGTHDELMRAEGEYCRLFRLQAAWYA